MKSNGRKSKPKSSPARPQADARRASPTLRDGEDRAWLKVEELCELYQIAPMVRKSYVLSRFWAWATQIRIEPYLSVPLPRFLTQRDP